LKGGRRNRVGNRRRRDPLITGRERERERERGGESVCLIGCGEKKCEKEENQNNETRTTFGN